MSKTQQAQDITEHRHRAALEKIKALRASAPTPTSESTSEQESTPLDAHESTPTPQRTSTDTSPAVYTTTPGADAPQTPTSAHTPTHTSPAVYTPTPTNAPTHTRTHTPMPTPREHMVRTQIYLRPDQIEWLDQIARETGRGVTRSDWVRYAVDELRRAMESETTEHDQG